MGKGKNGQNSKKAVVILIVIVFFSSFNIMQVATSGESEKIEMLGFPAGWSDDVPLSPATGPDETHNSTPNIAIWNNNIHIVRNGAIGWNTEIYYVRSTDSGKTWDKNDLVTPNDGAPCMFPKIATNNSILHLIYENWWSGFREVVYRNSTDNGETWSAETPLSPDDLQYSQNPSIAVNGSNVHVVWEDGRDDAVGLFEIYYKRSTDGGITWDDGLGNIGQDRRLTTNLGWNDVGAYVETSGEIVHVIWTRRTASFDRWETMYIRSVDNGASWSSPVMLTEEDTWHSGAQAIAVNDSGGVHVLWTEYKYGTEDVCYRNSTNNGVTWNPEVRLNANANESEQPDIAVNGTHVFVTWQDDRDHYDYVGDPAGAFELYYIESFDSGASWGPEIRLTYAVNESAGPAVAMDANNIHIAWTDNRTNGSRNQIFYKRFPDFPDINPPDHSNETPPSESYRDAPGTNVSVHVTDLSGVNETTIQLYINGSLVTHTSTPILDGFNVSYISPGFNPGVVECRIVADDNLSNHLDYTWNFTVLALYEIQLHEGWNLISVPHVQVDTSIAEVLRDIDGKWDYIQWYEASDGIDHWKSYATFKPQQLNDLFVINRTMAIWINIIEPNVNLTVRGHISTYTEIQLYAGWNLVGYSTLYDTETVGNALWGTGADMVEVFDPVAPYRIREVGPEYVMKPGEGYWVRVPEDTVWIVDW